MRIFEAERDAGLEEIIKANKHITFSAPVEIVNDEQVIQSIKASDELEIKDPYLSYFRSILASVGWNHNDDVALAEDIYTARFTPEHKPFNFNHNEKDIIGHIVSNFMLDEEFNPIDMDTPFEDLPEKFHLGTGFVLYSDYWEDKTMRKRMETLIQEIKANKWNVSLEAWITDFDYAMQTKDGKMVVVARNEKNAYLTEHLRAFGGNGVYKDARIGRVMRGVRFKGEGLVKRPGNPHSVILTASKVTETKVMSENTTVKELEVVQAELKQKNEVITALQKKLEDFEAKKYTEEITSLKAQLESATKATQEKDEQLKQVSADLKAAKDTLTESAEAMQTLKSKLDEIEAERKLTSRVSALVAAGLSQEDATAKAQSLVSASDDIFETVISLVKSNAKATAKTPGTNTQDLETVEDTETTVNASAATETVADKVVALSAQIGAFLGKDKS